MTIYLDQGRTALPGQAIGVTRRTSRFFGLKPLPFDQSAFTKADQDRVKAAGFESGGGGQLKAIEPVLPASTEGGQNRERLG
ncbi:hypothetical protein AEYBE204_02780 [Asticcacaulis sp. YBE204]|nr:hypothetical protein AEYBE204_02780 [Asticcacaulis sp. YBE204]